MAGPQNGVMGDDNFGTTLPQTEVSEEQLSVEKNLAKYSKSEEFKRFESHIKERIAFYDKWLPSGQSLHGSAGGFQNPGEPPLTNAQLGEQWRVASLLIGEFEALLAVYRNADEVVTAAAKQNA